VNVVFANKDEALALTDTDNARDAANRWRLQRCVAITMDDKGSLLRAGEAEHEIPSSPVKAVDTTGGGDMYAAGLLYGLSQNLPLDVSGRIASYAAAQVVAKLGPRLESIDQTMIERLKAGERFRGICWP
jgi:sugar/nucleoside kinase (ribokinase family)